MDKGMPAGDLQYIVICSCGRKNTLELIGDTFKPLGNKKWSFKSQEWTCGRNSHTQASTSTRTVPNNIKLHTVARPRVQLEESNELS